MDSDNGQVIASATSPKQELPINAPHPGWAEQYPEIWWKHVKLSTNQLLSKAHIDIDDIKAIGISYQMHGLVLADKINRYYDLLSSGLTAVLLRLAIRLFQILARKSVFLNY